PGPLNLQQNKITLKYDSEATILGSQCSALQKKILLPWISQRISVFNFYNFCVSYILNSKRVVTNK
ncbi:hypothetical protein L9F63_006214, partial [Diploptera punctata]